MGFDDKIKSAAEEAAGKVKEWVGDKTGNERLEAEGKLDQASAKTKQAVEAVKDDVKETFRDAGDRASDKVENLGDRMAMKVGNLGDKVADTADEVKDRADS